MSEVCLNLRCATSVTRTVFGAQRITVRMMSTASLIFGVLEDISIKPHTRTTVEAGAGNCRRYLITIINCAFTCIALDYAYLASYILIPGVAVPTLNTFESLVLLTSDHSPLVLNYSCLVSAPTHCKGNVLL